MHIGLLIVEEESVYWFANCVESAYWFAHCGERECILACSLWRERVYIGLLIVEKEIED